LESASGGGGEGGGEGGIDNGADRRLSDAQQWKSKPSMCTISTPRLLLLLLLPFLTSVGFGAPPLPLGNEHALAPAIDRADSR